MDFGYKFSFLFLLLLVSGCDKENDISLPCSPLIAVNGYEEVTTQEGVLLRLPKYTDIRRYSGGGLDCEVLRALFVDYLWYEAELIPEGINRFKVERDKAVKVRLYYKGSGKLDDLVGSEKADKRSWVFDGALPHKLFPLELYPKYYWDDADNPSEKSIKASRLDSRWGVVGTKYRNGHNDKRFTTSCSIPPLRKSDFQSRVENSFAEYGDSKCRGNITVAKNGSYVTMMIDVWAFNGSESVGITEIDHIYDAIVERIEDFIKDRK